MNNEIDAVVTPEVYEAIQKKKRERGHSMKSIMRFRGKQSIESQDPSSKTVTMSDRSYTVEHSGWRVN